MDILRQEIIETQKARSELIKWKLLLVSTLAATGLGFAKSESDSNAEVVLCCIPFVCAYVDAQYASLSLRIMAIATFFREVAPSVGVHPALIEYENLMDLVRTKVDGSQSNIGPQSPQSWIVLTSSVLFSGLIALYATSSLLLDIPELYVWLAVVMFFSGLGGVGFNVWLFYHHRRRWKVIEETGAKFVPSIIFSDNTTEEAESDRPS